MSTRPAIPQGAPPPYMFVSRVYKKSLRPVVIVSASCSAIWTLLWGIANFRDIDHDRRGSLSLFVPWDIILGSLFCAAAVIEGFGIFAAVTQRLPLVRLYAFGTIIAGALVFGAQVINIVLDFKYRSKLLAVCISANTGDDVVVSDGWRGTAHEKLNADDARNWCNGFLTRETVGDFAWLVVSTILAVLFTSIAFSFYRQLLDPNFSRAPSSQIRMQAFNAYPPAGQPYGASYRYDQDDYVPPYDGNKLPMYQGSGRQTPEKDGDQKQAWEEQHHGYAVPSTNPFERKAEEP